MILFIFWG